MSRLEDALRRAGRRTTMPETINAPSARALDWFAPVDETAVRTASIDPPAAALPVPPQIAAPVPAPASPTPVIDAPIPSVHVHVPVGHSTPFAERLVAYQGMTPVAVEQYRRLAATLHHAQRDRGARVLMVASAVPGEGKTLTVANLALTLSESYRRRVLVIDADLRRPMIHAMIGIANGQGLSDVLKAPEDRRPAVIEVSSRLHVLTAGRPDPDPMSGLTSERMFRVIREARDRFDWVVLDTPPLALLPDANLLAAMVDLAVMVVGAGRTPLKMIERAVDAIGRERIVGVVLNRVDEQNVTPEYSSDRYQYRYAATEGSASA